MDTKLSPAQIDPHHGDDVTVLASKDWTDAEEALTQLAHAASNRRRPAARSDFSAGPRVSEPSLDPTLRGADVKGPLPIDRPLSRRQSPRGLARFGMAACVGIAATLIWQSYSGAAREMIATVAPPLGWLLLPSSAMNTSAGGQSAGDEPGSPAVSSPVPQAAPAQAAPVAPAAAETAAIVPAAPSAELQQQLETMVHDLAAVRQSVEQLAAGQEQMAREIAKLHTPAPDIRRRISPPPVVGVTPALKPVPLPSAQSATTAPLSLPPPQPAPSSATPLTPPPPEPPRPPMPVR